MKLILHIGHPKVGSTSIQFFLRKNFELLKAQGILSSDRNLDFPTDIEPRGPTAIPFEGVKDDLEASKEFVEGKLAETLYKIRKLDYKVNKLIISAENLSAENAEFLFSDVSKNTGVKIEVIYYVRRQDAWITSAWKQWHIKTGIDLEQFVDEFLEEKSNQMFIPNINKWSSVSSKVSVGMLNSKVLWRGDLLYDFCKKAGIRPKGLKFTEPQNPSFGEGLLDVISTAPYLFESRLDNNFFSFLNEYLPRRSFVEVKKKAMQGEARARVMSYYRQENLFLHKNYFEEVSFEDLFGVSEVSSNLENERIANLEKEVHALREAVGNVLAISYKLAQDKDA